MRSNSFFAVLKISTTSSSLNVELAANRLSTSNTVLISESLNSSYTLIPFWLALKTKVVRNSTAAFNCPVWAFC